jgi:hypothetical protein
MVPTKPSRAANCALYARAETGVALYGDAGGWWDQAEGRYARGHMPAVGAILVFKRTRQIPSGHVAVVAQIISAHEILVDHANWYHGTVSRGVSVIDTSPDHDWSSVAVMDLPSGTHGRDYPAHGFVYPRPGLQEIAEIREDRRAVDADFVRESSRPALLQLAVATENWHGASTTRRNHQLKGAAAHPAHKVSGVHLHNGPVARANLPPPGHPSHAGIARSPTHPVRTAESKHHRV